MEKFLHYVDAIGQLLPVTVVVAVMLFALKEVLEFKRRQKTNARKRQALRRLIAEEIKINFRKSSNLRQALKLVDRHLSRDRSKLTVSLSPSGIPCLRQSQDESGETITHTVSMGQICSDTLFSNISLLAELDEDIFDDALEALSSYRVLNDNILTVLEWVSGDDHEKWLFALGYYVEEHLPNAEKNLKDFYQRLTGTPLIYEDEIAASQLSEKHGLS